MSLVRTRFRPAAALLIVLLSAADATAQAPAAQRPPEPADEPARRERLDFMKQKSAEFRLFRETDLEDPLSTTAEPVLRFSNPVRNSFSDGTIFLWLDGKRPAAAASLSIRGNAGFFREFSSLSPDGLRCRLREAEIWSPRAGSVKAQVLQNAPTPAASAALRQAQMRRLAARFVVRMHGEGDQPQELRLLAQPLYRYVGEQAGVLDGALFAFVETTDPEALLVIEARRAGYSDATSWWYTWARMTSRPLTAHDRPPESSDAGREVWSVDSYWQNPRSPTDPYSEAFVERYPAMQQ